MLNQPKPRLSSEPSSAPKPRLSSVPKNLKALEEATPELIEKLTKLTKTLSPEEKLVFSEIIELAALHTSLVQAHDEGAKDLDFAKPKSVHSTTNMKRQYAALPKTLGLGQKD